MSVEPQIEIRFGRGECFVVTAGQLESALEGAQVAEMPVEDEGRTKEKR